MAPRNLLRSELYAARATPTTWWIGGAGIAIAVGATILTLLLSTVHSGKDVRSLLSFGGTPGLVLVIYGVVVGAGAYRHRTIVPTVLTNPDRVRVVATQAVAVAGVGTLVGLSAEVVTLAIALPWLAALGVHPGVSIGVIANSVIGGVAYCAFGAAFGLGIGALARNQAAAVSIIFVYLAIVDPSISALVPSYGKFGPTALGVAISGGVAGSSNGPYDKLLSQPAAFVLLLVVALVAVSAAAGVTARRDLA